MSKKRSNTGVDNKNLLANDANDDYTKNKKSRLPPHGEGKCTKVGCGRIAAEEMKREVQHCAKHLGMCDLKECKKYAFDNNKRGPQLCLKHRTERRKEQNKRSSKDYIKRLKTSKIDVESSKIDVESSKIDVQSIDVTSISEMFVVFETINALQDLSNNKNGTES
jgi:hypothetical protein